MAQQALPAGRTQTRGRAFFGLFDRDGWGWASAKAVFWFIVIIFLLGYIPDRAYYFVVNRTIDIGILAWSPINFCPPSNETLPCPAPVGATIPWEVAPQEIYLPEPRVDGAAVQSGTKLLFIGGRNAAGEATDTTFVSTASGPGNFDVWDPDGPKLPEARADAAVAFAGGSIFVMGGFGPDGAPTDTVYILQTSGQTGELGEWQTAEEAGFENLALQEPVAGAVLVPATDGLILVGGTTDGTTPIKSVWKSTYDRAGELQPWVKQADLYTAVMDHAATGIGSFMWVYGGTSPEGPTRTVQRGEFGTDTQTTTLVRWGVAGGNIDLPEPRTDGASFTANGVMYLVGGSDGTSPQTEMYWAIPDANGNIPEWKHLPQSDLPESSGGIAGAASIVLGPDAVLLGGETASGPTAGAARTNLAPQEPFFQLGLVGATVPALKIDGEIGQQLGYLAANSVGIGNFVILLFIGWLYAHPQKVAAFRDWLRARRARRSR